MALSLTPQEEGGPVLLTEFYTQGEGDCDPLRGTPGGRGVGPLLNVYEGGMVPLESLCALHPCMIHTERMS